LSWYPVVGYRPLHDEEEVLGLDEIGMARQVVPADQGGQVALIPVEGHEEAHLTAFRFSGDTVAGLIEKDPVVREDPMAGK